MVLLPRKAFCHSYCPGVWLGGVGVLLHMTLGQQSAGWHQGAMPSDRHKLPQPPLPGRQDWSMVRVVFARLSLHVLCSPAEHISQSESAACPHVTAGRLETWGRRQGPQKSRVMGVKFFGNHSPPMVIWRSNPYQHLWVALPSMAVLSLSLDFQMQNKTF